jgi:hypothetical protein
VNDEQMNQDSLDKVLQQLWAEPIPPGVRVYALADAARNEKVFPSVTGCQLKWDCLYIGEIPNELRQVAPYLVQLEKEDPFTASFITDGWEDHWGIFARAPVRLPDLHKHFRKFLTVVDESGKQLVFRFYDPRIFRAFLPSCTPEELEQIFGPVQEFIVPGQEPSTILRFRMEERRLIQQKDAL